MTITLDFLASFVLKLWFRRTNIWGFFVLLDSDFHTSNSTFRQ